MENEELEVNHWFINDEYYKGDLSNLEIWVKGDISFVKNKWIKLYEENGDFYKEELVQTHKDKKADIKVNKGLLDLIQVDYNFYIIPVSERHSLKDGRNKTHSMLSDFGLKGLNKDYEQHFTELSEYPHKRIYEITRPLEFMYSNEYRFNLHSFMNFNYKQYLLNYNNFIKIEPDWKSTADYLFKRNVKIICDFYRVTEEILKRDNFDKVKYSIAALNRKINEKKKNNY